jgi:hypothetical protein
MRLLTTGDAMPPISSTPKWSLAAGRGHGYSWAVKEVRRINEAIEHEIKIRTPEPSTLRRDRRQALSEISDLGDQVGSTVSRAWLLVTMAQ